MQMDYERTKDLFSMDLYGKTKTNHSLYKCALYLRLNRNMKAAIRYIFKLRVGIDGNADSLLKRHLINFDEDN